VARSRTISTTSGKQDSEGLLQRAGAEVLVFEVPSENEIKVKKKSGAGRGLGADSTLPVSNAQRGNGRGRPEASKLASSTTTLRNKTVTPSNEVNDATGEAPARKDTEPSVFEVLTAKRRELHTAIRALAAAEANYDTDSAVKEQQKVDVLIRFIDTLARQHSAVLNATAADRAQAWLVEQRKGLSDLGQRVAEAQEQVKDALQIVQAKIAAEAQVRAVADQFYLVEEVFAARFGLPWDKKTRGVELPALEDYAAPVLAAVDVLRPSRREHPGLVYPFQASDTPEVRLQKRLTAATVWLKKYRKSLPTEVQAILNDAPVPEPEVEDTRRFQKLEDGSEAVIGMGQALSTALPNAPLGSL
jgi:hypothetical protein